MELEGARVGHVRLVATIGAGGMGAVYEGYDEVLQRRVAVKTIHAERSFSAEAKGRFLREARLLSRLDHPNICRIFDLVEGEDNDFLILELVEGQTLSQLPVTELSYDDKLRIAEEVASALAAAHHEHVVHRDLKPENVMVTPEGQVKVLDFGIARSLADSPGSRQEIGPLDSPGDQADDSSHDPVSEEEEVRTRFGSLLGTLRYMSPEQARGDPVTEASDIYSFGILLQELFTGQRAYQEQPLPQQLLYVAEGKSLPMTGADADITALIKSLKSVEADDRPDAAETMKRLRWIREKPERRRRRWLRLAGAAAVMMALVATAVVSRWQVEQPLLDPQQQGRVVLFPFVNDTGDAQLDWVEQGLMEMVAATLDETEGIDVVASDELAQAVDSEQSIIDAGTDEVLRLIQSLGAELAIQTRVRREKEQYILEYASYNVNGSSGRRQVEAKELTEAAGHLSARLVRRIRPGARLIELSDRFSADPFVNRLFAMGLQRFHTAGAIESGRYFEICLDIEPDLAWAKLELVKVHDELGEWDEALALAIEIEKQAVQQERPRLEAASLGLQALIAWRRAAYSEARQMAEQARQLYRELGDGEGEADILMRLASIARYQNPAEAQRFAEASLAAQRRLGDRFGEAQALHTLAILVAEAGRNERAAELFEQALALERELGYRRLEAQTLNSLGILAFEAGEVDRGAELFRQSLAIHEQMGNMPSYSVGLSNLGALLFEQKRLGEAEELQRRAFAIADELDYTETRALAAFNLAFILAQSGRLEEGERYLEISRNYYGDLWDVLYVDALLADLRGEARRALDLAEQAKELGGEAWGEEHERTLGKLRAR